MKVPLPLLIALQFLTRLPIRLPGMPAPEALGRSLLPADDVLTDGNGRWSCESCSDPDCEHRLFSQLVTTDHTKDPPP